MVYHNTLYIQLLSVVNLDNFIVRWGVLLMGNKYVLREDVRLFYNNKDEIRFRKGIWNFVEAVINLGNESERNKEAIHFIVDRLLESGEMDLNEVINKFGLTPQERNDLSNTLDNMKFQGFFCGEKEKLADMVMASLIGGNLEDIKQYGGSVKPIILLSDNDIAKEVVKNISLNINIPVDILNDQDFNDLTQSDLFSKKDAITTMQKIDQFEKIFEPYACVMTIFATPNVTSLRNLNRVLIRIEKPMVAGYLDGPFLSFFSICAPETGCYECLENRIIARMQDMINYHQFIKKAGFKNTAKSNKHLTPLLYWITSFVINEAYMYSYTTISRLVGRVINIYLPVLEIQIQDLLRVPYCSACGYLAKSNIEELYTSSRNIIEQMVNRIEITKEA